MFPDAGDFMLSGDKPSKGLEEELLARQHQQATVSTDEGRSRLKPHTPKSGKTGTQLSSPPAHCATVTGSRLTGFLANSVHSIVSFKKSPKGASFSFNFIRSTFSKWPGRRG